MRVVLASTSVPHVAGGSRLIVKWTAQAMREAGHEVEEYLLPFPTAPRQVLTALIGLRATPFAGSGDRLVAIRWPAHVIRHENKATWFIHHYRELFDLWDSPHRQISSDAEAAAYRETLRRVDNLGLSESRAVFSNSGIVRDRLKEFNGVDAEPLFPPLGGDLSRFHTDAYGDFIFYPSRVTPIKRQLLAIEAMRHTTSGVRLVIAGAPEEPGFGELLRHAVHEHNLGDKVQLRLGWLDEQDKDDLYAECLAVAYVPLGEDSYGYPSLEASHSRKPVITVTDSGGVVEFVRDESEGLVVRPDARSLAAAFDRLYEDRGSAQRMGDQCFARRAELDIAWPRVIDRLLGVGA